MCYVVPCLFIIIYHSLSLATLESAVSRIEFQRSVRSCLESIQDVEEKFGPPRGRVNNERIPRRIAQSNVFLPLGLQVNSIYMPSVVRQALASLNKIAGGRVDARAALLLLYSHTTAST